MMFPYILRVYPYFQLMGLIPICCGGFLLVMGIASIAGWVISWKKNPSNSWMMKKSGHPHDSGNLQVAERDPVD